MIMLIAIDVVISTFAHHLDCILDAAPYSLDVPFVNHSVKHSIRKFIRSHPFQSNRSLVFGMLNRDTRSFLAGTQTGRFLDVHLRNSILNALPKRSEGCVLVQAEHLTLLAHKKLRNKSQL